MDVTGVESSIRKAMHNYSHAQAQYQTVLTNGLYLKKHPLYYCLSVGVLLIGCITQFQSNNSMSSLPKYISENKCSSFLSDPPLSLATSFYDSRSMGNSGYIHTSWKISQKGFLLRLSESIFPICLLRGQLH